MVHQQSRSSWSAVFAWVFLFVLAGSWLGPSSGCAKKEPGPHRPVVAAILMQQDQFFQLNEQGMRAAAEKLGVDLKVQNATGGLDREISIVDTYVAQRVGAIVVSPLSTQGSIPALKRAHEAGVKVITYNNSVAADFPACNVASDQAALGAETGRVVREYVEQKLGGKAKVALLGFASQLPEQGGARQAGFKQAIADMPGVQIVAEQDAWTAPQAATTVSEILMKHPDVIWAANEGGTVGAVTAVRNAGLTGKVAVFGTDISKQLADFLLADDGILHAVTAQKPFEMGSTAVETAVAVLKGESVAKNKTLPGVLFTRDRPEEVKSYQQRLAELSR